MKELYFATGNSVKIARAQTNLNGIYTVNSINLDMIEPQTLDQEYIAKYKVEQAYDVLKKPVFAEDVGLYIEKFNEFPGVLTKFILKGIGLDGIKKLINEGEKAYYKAVIAFKNEQNEFTVDAKISGKLTVNKISNNFNPKAPFKSMFIPDGYDRTIADLSKEEDDNLPYSKGIYEEFIKKLNDINF